MALRDLRLVSRQPIGPPLSEAPDADAAVSILELESQLLDLYTTGLQPGVSTGWHSLDPHYTIKPGQVTVVTGVPHSGKSPFVNAMALHCVVAHGWTIAISSPEHLPYANLAARFLEQFYKNLSFTEGTAFRMTAAQIMQACDVLAPRLYFLPPSETDATIHHVLARCLPLLEKGLRGLVIDPYGEFEHRRPSGMSETEYISQLLTEIRLFA